MGGGGGWWCKIMVTSRLRCQIWWKITITITSRYQICGRGKTLHTHTPSHIEMFAELLRLPLSVWVFLVINTSTSKTVKHSWKNRKGNTLRDKTTYFARENINTGDKCPGITARWRVVLNQTHCQQATAGSLIQIPGQLSPWELSSKQLSPRQSSSEQLSPGHQSLEGGRREL